LLHIMYCIYNFTCTEDAPVLDRLAPLRRFYAIPARNTNEVIYLLTYLLTYNILTMIRLIQSCQSICSEAGNCRKSTLCLNKKFTRFIFCDNFPSCKPIQKYLAKIADKILNKLTNGNFDMYS